MAHFLRTRRVYHLRYKVPFQLSVLDFLQQRRLETIEIPIGWTRRGHSISSIHPIRQRCKGYAIWCLNYDLLVEVAAYHQHLGRFANEESLYWAHANHSDNPDHHLLWRHRSYLHSYQLCAYCMDLVAHQWTRSWAIWTATSPKCAYRWPQKDLVQANHRWCTGDFLQNIEVNIEWMKMKK